jgi:hypothetical protein
LNETAVDNINSKWYHVPIAFVAPVRRLLRRLVTSLLDESDPWHGPQGDGNELATFEDYTEEFFHESSRPPGQLLNAMNEETLFDSDLSDSDDE